VNATLSTIFGEGTELTVAQMAARGVVVFLLTLAMLRMSGRRSFGQHSSFDACVTVLLGSILARAVVGASPFLPTMATGIALVLLHRFIAMISVRVPSVDRLVNGVPRTLFENGQLAPSALKRALISQADILQALREQANVDSLAEARQITLERNGIVSVVRWRPERAN
jgi:uncharacterized membrane protein YcaP (DUF421 family)